MRSDVLIIGAGPTGLVLALWLTKLGVKVRIIDKTAEAGTTSRALAVQARTLELYRQLDLADTVVACGHKVPAVNLWVRGEPKAHLSFETIGSDLCEASYIAGCDGARSIVRETIGTGFPGGTYRQVFYVADVEAGGRAVDGELHVDLDEADFLAVFPLADKGRARLIGTVRDERADRAEALKFQDVSDRAINNLKVQVNKVNWFSTYHVHHRVTSHFRTGRTFLLGDAAHIHSPAGGQGMNTGIGDAINLAWKLAAVLAGRAPDKLLDSYEAERIGFARRLVATTDRVFSFVTAEGRMADILRTRVAPVLIPKITQFEIAREYLFRTVSQITLNYRRGPLSRGAAGHVHGGDRLPWVSVDGKDNFTSLTAMTWQIHVYGTASAELTGWCTGHCVPLHVFDWRSEYETAGLARDAVYLLRPDTYVALADTSGDPNTLNHYCAEQGIQLLAADGGR
jgi:2-polyprenyl-6-methoxyphenol hydroxylase-like FAD-dependent oxidoreductase